jgi:DNA adenine methylase
MARSNRTLQPFLKWAGGKGQLLEQYELFFPTEPMNCYFEPFVGSGAVFFYLRERDLFDSYYLSDVNKELIACYRVIKQNVDGLIAELTHHKKNHEKSGKDYYYHVRAWDRDPNWPDLSDVIHAARMIYLNKTCYNGLWRVNSQGQFNVPVGSYKNPDILNEERLLAAAEALQNVRLSVQDFQQTVSQASSGDFVYFDPPYDPLNNTSNFWAGTAKYSSSNICGTGSTWMPSHAK